MEYRLKGNGYQLLSKEQCTVMKGVAILMIMLHNVCHWLPDGLMENEYMIHTANTDAFFKAISHFDWQWPLHWFSFLGHYGVPMFVFLSAYGLVKKYETNLDKPQVGQWKFVWGHYKKLFVLVCLGLFTLWLLQPQLMPIFDTRSTLVPSLKLADDINYLIPGEYWPLQASMTINFSPWPMPWNNTRFILGPYWYFGFVLQLYVIYRLLLYTRRRDTMKAWLWPIVFAVGCGLVMDVVYMCGTLPALKGLHLQFMLYVWRYNFIIGVLPFSIGLLVARYEHKIPRFDGWQWWVILVLAFVAVPLMNCNVHLWLWAPAIVVAGGIALVKVMGRWVAAPLRWVGSISMMVFLLHPIVRMLFYKIDQAVNTPSFIYTMLAIYLAISLVFAWIYQTVYNKVNRRLKR